MSVPITPADLNKELAAGYHMLVQIDTGSSSFNARLTDWCKRHSFGRDVALVGVCQAFLGANGRVANNLKPEVATAFRKAQELLAAGTGLDEATPGHLRAGRHVHALRDDHEAGAVVVRRLLPDLRDRLAEVLDGIEPEVLGDMLAALVRKLPLEQVASLLSHADIHVRPREGEREKPEGAAKGEAKKPKPEGAAKGEAKKPKPEGAAKDEAKKPKPEGAEGEGPKGDAS